MKKTPVKPEEKPKRPAHIGMKYLTPEETDRFFAAIEDQRDSLIFTLMLREGLRVGEVVGEELDYWTKNGHRCKKGEIPEDIFDCKVNEEINVKKDTFIHVQQRLDGLYIEDINWAERQLMIRGKGDKTRYVPLADDVFVALSNYIKLEEREPEDKAGKIFDINPPAVRYHCRNYAKKAGIARRVHPHIFRHTFAVRYLQAIGEKGLRSLQIILGHNSLAVTERYLQITGKDVKTDFDKVNEIQLQRKVKKQETEEKETEDV